MKTLRRARPLLSTLVEVGIAGAGPGDVQAAFAAAFEAVAGVQACMSRFEPHSDIGRFHALPVGAEVQVDSRTARVLQAAAWLHERSHGLFDIALGSAVRGWRCEGHRLVKLQAGVRLDLGGIAKGHAVDAAVEALQTAGCSSGWVNAGGDLRAFGALDLPVSLRDEERGGVRPFGRLSDGAFATSRFGGETPALAGSPHGPAAEAHVSVMAPLCLWADAFTKLVALSGRTDHPLLAEHGAHAWQH